MLRYLACWLIAAVGFADSWSAPGTSAPLFSPPVTASTDFEVFLTSDSQNGQVLATWQDAMSRSPTYSFYNGTGWSNPAFIPGGSEVGNDVITCFNSSSGQFLATWGDFTNSEPYYSIYTNGSWSTAAAIPSATLAPGNNAFNVYDPVRGFFWAAWSDQTSGYPAYGHYNGSWNTGQISNSSQGGDTIFLSIDSAGNLLAVWQDTISSFPTYSIYNGSSWSTASPISTASTANGVVESCFDSVAGRFVAAWVDGTSFFPTTSFYNGSTWSPATTIPPVSPSSGGTRIVSLSFAPSSGLLLATWTDGTNSFPTYSLYNDSSWTNPTTISTLAPIIMGFGVYSCYDSQTNQFFAAWSGQFTPTYSIYSISQPLIPVQFSGVQIENNFGIVKELYNALSWQSNTNVTTYYLYRNGVQIAVLDGAADSYEDHNQPSNGQVYSLVAVNGTGRSSPAEVTVGGNP